MQNYDILFGIPAVPIIASSQIGTFRMAETFSASRAFTCLSRGYSEDDLIRFYTDTSNADIIPFSIYTMGPYDDELAKFNRVLEGIQVTPSDVDAQTEPRIVCINLFGTTKLIPFIASFREEHPSTIIIAGDVYVSSSVEALLDAGANYVKVGFIPDIEECAQVAYEAQGALIVDLGWAFPEDLNIAFRCGAKAVMLSRIVT